MLRVHSGARRPGAPAPCCSAFLVGRRRALATCGCPTTPCGSMPQPTSGWACRGPSVRHRRRRPRPVLAGARRCPRQPRSWRLDSALIAASSALTLGVRERDHAAPRRRGDRPPDRRAHRVADDRARPRAARPVRRLAVHRGDGPRSGSRRGSCSPASSGPRRRACSARTTSSRPRRRPDVDVAHGAPPRAAEHRPGRDRPDSRWSPDSAIIAESSLAVPRRVVAGPRLAGDARSAACAPSCQRLHPGRSVPGRRARDRHARVQPARRRASRRPRPRLHRDAAIADARQPPAAAATNPVEELP